MKKDIVDIYAHWFPIENPLLVGRLTHINDRGNEQFLFHYAGSFIESKHRFQLDPDLDLALVHYLSKRGKNFKVFLDSAPDRWGRTLIEYRARLEYEQGIRRTRHLGELDYLLGVHDLSRMGALRFKRPDGENFLDDSDELAAPPMTSLRELEHAALQLTHDLAGCNPWVAKLIAPGSSLGGARPKASVTDDKNHLWIAKFPARDDRIDMGAWEMVAHHLAVAAGIEMSECQAIQLNSSHHTFLTKRFDRNGQFRIHFSSAMTQLGYYDGDHDKRPSYLEIAEFLMRFGGRTREDLHQLWRRIIFNIAISNTDDHLRNHGFLLTPKGWVLSPAYDLNPSPHKDALSLAINDFDRSLDFRLAFEVIDFFMLDRESASAIFDQVMSAVANWRCVARSLGISRAQIDMFSSAFKTEYSCT